MNLAWLRLRAYGSISLAICLVEILIIWGGTGLALAAPQIDWRWFRTVMIYAYGLGFFGSFIFSIVGMAIDSRRVLAVVAMATSVVNLVICSLPIAY
jgi:hypothetical protein